MILDEIRAIREKQSLETIGMTTEQLHAYFSKGADALEKMMKEIRQEKSNKTHQTKKAAVS